MKVSNIENTSESTTATGGQGNPNLITWSYGRSATLNITDALLSMKSLAMLAGSDVKEGATRMYSREYFAAATDSVELKETPIADTVYAYEMVDGEMGDEAIATVTGKEVSFTTAFPNATPVVVYYEYESDAKAQLVEISGKKFPGAFKVVGFGVVRNQNGIDEAIQIQIPNAQLKTDFTLTLDAENVSTFDFNLDINADGEDSTLYKFIRIPK